MRLFDPNKDNWFIEINKGNGWDVFYDEKIGSNVAVSLLLIPYYFLLLFFYSKELRLIYVQDPSLLIYLYQGSI